MTRSMFRPGQRGTVLLMSLVILLIMSVIALSAVRLTTTSIKIGANDELAVESFQNAQSIIDGTFGDPNNMAVTGEVGACFCTAGIDFCFDGTECSTLNQLTLPDGLFATELLEGKVRAEVQRLAPEFQNPPRQQGSSMTKFQVASFTARAVYAPNEAADAGLGHDVIDQGLLQSIPAGN